MFRSYEYTYFFRAVVKTVLGIGGFVTATAAEFLVIRLLTAHFDFLNITLLLLTAGLLFLLGYCVKIVGSNKFAM